jgi:hypothetical protein
MNSEAIAEKPVEPTYEEKRAARVTRRQEKEAKRQYDYLKGVLRSQLRRQIDKIATENGKDLIFAMLNGARLQVGVTIEMPKEADAPKGERAGSFPSEPVPPKPLIEVVRS